MASFTVERIQSIGAPFPLFFIFSPAHSLAPSLSDQSNWIQANGIISLFWGSWFGSVLAAQIKAVCTIFATNSPPREYRNENCSFRLILRLDYRGLSQPMHLQDRTDNFNPENRLQFWRTPTTLAFNSFFFSLCSLSAPSLYNVIFPMLPVSQSPLGNIRFFILSATMLMSFLSLVHCVCSLAALWEREENKENE